MRQSRVLAKRQDRASARSRFLRGVIAIIVFGLLFAGCQAPEPTSPMPERSPPVSAEGQLCVAQCQTTHWRCETRQRDQLRLCAGEARLALRACRAEAQDQRYDCYSRLRAIHGDAWRSHQSQCSAPPHDRCERPVCQQSRACDDAYEDCFQRCGGRISPGPTSSQPDSCLFSQHPQHPQHQQQDLRTL